MERGYGVTRLALRRPKLTCNCDPPRDGFESENGKSDTFIITDEWCLLFRMRSGEIVSNSGQLRAHRVTVLYYYYMSREREIRACALNHSPPISWRRTNQVSLVGTDRPVTAAMDKTSIL